MDYAQYKSNLRKRRNWLIFWGLLLVLCVASVLHDKHLECLRHQAEQALHAEFTASKETIINEIETYIEQGKYYLADRAAKPYESIEDTDLTGLQQRIDRGISEQKEKQRIADLKADFDLKRDDLLNKMRNALRDRQDFTTFYDASAYITVADDKFVKLYKKLEEAKVIADKTEAARPYIEDIQRELKSFDNGDIKIPDTHEGIKLTLAIFSVHAQNIEKAKNYNLTNEDQRVVNRYKKEVIAWQKRAFPKIRDLYGPIARKLVWENDMSVRTYGNGFRTIEYVGGTFAANRNIKEFLIQVHAAHTLYRFKQIRFKWFKGASEYTYFNLDTPKDRDLVVFTNGDTRIVD
ncbi:MAG: hypothetical protein ACRBCT_02275 [Alphaproteobacteria bacterium]